MSFAAHDGIPHVRCQIPKRPRKMDGQNIHPHGRLKVQNIFLSGRVLEVVSMFVPAMCRLVGDRE